MNPIHSFKPYLPKIHFNIILRSSLVLPSSLFVLISRLSHACYVPHPPHPHWFDQVEPVWDSTSNSGSYGLLSELLLCSQYATSGYSTWMKHLTQGLLAFSRPGAGNIHRFLSTRGPQEYKWGQFTETPWQFIKNVAKLSLLLQTGWRITQYFSLIESVISEIFKTAFAWVIPQYQVKVLLLQFAHIRWDAS
jgi:hypothetical protein